MKRIVFALAILLAVSGTCFAETSEWKDSRFNFKSIKNIAFGGPSVSNDVKDQFAMQKSIDYFLSAFDAAEKKSGVRIVSLDSVIDAIGKDQGVNLFDLRKSDFNQFKKIFVANVSKYCDAILTAHVISMGYGTVRREASVDSWTSYQTDTYTVNGSIYNVSGPSTNYRFIPSHDVTIVSGGLYTSLISMQTGTMIWGVTDVRDRTNKVLSKTTPSEMLRRIINSNVDKMLEAMK